MAQARVLSSTAKGGNRPPMPQGRPQAVPTPTPNRLDALVRALEDVQLSDQHDLYQALEAFRMLGHRLAIEGMLMATELEAGAKAAARSRNEFGLVGGNAGRKIRRTVKAFKRMADGFATAGAMAPVAWNQFVKDFADDLGMARTEPRERRGFRINPN